ncbi:outer membrane assembly lipoprotein YfiO, partial [Pseudomonas aeruginosa]
LAPDNPPPNRDKAIEYLRRPLLAYPEGELSNKARRHLDQALNVKPRGTPPD